MPTCPKCSSQIGRPADSLEGKVVCQVCNAKVRFRAKPSSSGTGKDTIGGVEPESRRSKAKPGDPAGGGGGTRADGGRPHSRPKSPRLHEGDFFDHRYTIMEELGSGNFGRVYRAFDEKRYRDVALKVPSRDIANDRRFLRRFAAEAEILSRLEHPCIVRFYDAILEASPRYLVTQYLAGRNLEAEFAEERAAGRKIDRVRALTIARKLAEALHHAHLAGVIHRDVKPSNIMVHGEDVWLTDFGLARYGDPKLTQAGAKIGTPFYMSPEQVRADPALITAKSDQFGLGVVIYELLSGRLPFEGPTAESVYPKILADSPLSLTAIDPAIPQGLDAICQRALAKDPAQRWPSCAELESQLRKWLAALKGGPVPEPLPRPPVAPPSSSAPPQPLPAEPSPVEAGTIRKARGAIVGKLSQKLNETKTTIEPLVEAVSPLSESLKDTVRLSSGAFKSRWPGWVRGMVLWVTGWVDLLNEKLRHAHPEPLISERAPTSTSGGSSASRDGERKLSEAEIDTRSRSAAETRSRSGSGTASGPIPLQSVSGSSPRTWPSPASPTVSQVGDTTERSYRASLEAALQAWHGYQVKEAQAALDRCPLEIRGWEWAYLKALCRSPITTFLNHDGEVGPIAFDAAGKLMAAGEVGGVRLWNLKSRTLVGRFAAQLKRIDAVTLSEDGRLLASAGGRTIRIWDLEASDREPRVLSLQGHEAIVTRLAFAPDGIHLASASLDKSLRIWDFREETERSCGLAESGAANALSFQPGSDSILACGYHDGSVVLWNWLESSEVCRVTTPGNASVDDLAFHPSGRMLAVGGRNGMLTFLKAETLETLATADTRQGPILAVGFHPDGRWVATLGGLKDRRLRIAAGGVGLPASELGKEAAQLVFTSTMLTSFAFVPGPYAGGRLALAGGQDRTVKLWHDPSFWRTPGNPSTSTIARAIAIHPNGRHLAFAKFDGSVEMRDLTDQTHPRTLRGPGAPISALAFAPGDMLLATASDDGVVAFLDVATGGCVTRLPAGAGPLVSMALSPDGRRLATVAGDGVTAIWDARSGALIREVEDAEEATAVTFAGGPSDGLRLFTAGPDRMVHVWDVAGGGSIRSLEGHSGRILMLASDPDRRTVVSVAADRTLIVWDVDRLEAIQVLRDVDVLSGLAWHRASGVVAAVGEDGRLLVDIS